MWSCGARRHRESTKPRRSWIRTRLRAPHVSRICDRRRTAVLVVGGVLSLLPGCALGPNYQRPPVETPEITRGQTMPADAASLADLPWWEVFEDPVLQTLIQEAIAGNHDLKAAAARVEQAYN